MSMVRKTGRSVVLAVVLFALTQSVWAISMIEFMKLDSSTQYDVVKPMMVTFLGAGYKKVPDNAFTLVDRIKKITFEKGYVYQNLEEVAKEAAISLGMVRSF